jgi:RHS repeat-associated protein
MNLKAWKLILILLFPLLFICAGQARGSAPTISSLSPTTGAVGASVTVTGTNFGTTQGTSTITFNGTTATATSWGSTSILVTVPSGATTGSVIVTVSSVASNAKTFTVVSAPSITSLSITTGAVGAAVTITGTSFGTTQGSGSANFNGTTATVTSWNSTTIKVTVPSGATTGNVVVFASGVNSNGSSFTVVSAPSITSLSITTGAVGAAVTITGTNFGSTQGAGTASFNGKAATVTSWSATSIAVTVPSGATTGNVVVFASGVNSNGSSFTVVSAPSITSLSVTSGVVGTAVTITGTSFVATQGSGTVSFNGTLASVTSWSATSIAVTVPSGATTGNVVVFASGVNSNGKTFDVTPVISSLSPTTGAVGAAVTIAGTSFGPSQGTSTVKFNGTAATGTSWSATSIAVTVPSGATTGNVVVNTGVNSNGSSFTVVSAPVISSLSTTSGPVGAAVTVTGSNFGSTQGSGTVNFNGTAATVTNWGAASIHVTVPSGATTGNVVVFASGVNSNGSSFTVLPTPSITSLSIASGMVGEVVTVTGTNFGSTQGTSTVTFNGTAATASSWNATSIVTKVPSGATTGNVVVTLQGVGSNGATFTVTLIPTGWSDTDIGAVGLAGSSSYANETFTINASGQGVFTTADEIHFVYQPLSGDGSISARVVSLTGSSSPPAGVMIRETLNTGATSAFTAYRSSTIYFVNRATTGATSSYQTGASGAPLPYWVGIVRAGNEFSSYTSSDGVNWVQIGTTQTINMAQNVYMGLAASSDDNTSLSTSTFDNVSINTLSVPAPAITTISATTGPIGSQVVITGSGFGASQNGSLVTLNAQPVTINSWSSTSITTTIPSGATSGPLLVSVAPSMNDSNSFFFTVTSQPLPSGWLDQDIGPIGIAGSATFSSSIFTINASGQGVGSTVDQVHFAYQPLSGNGTIVARVVSFTGATYPQAGVMIRETLDDGATSAFISYESTTVYFWDRPTTGASTSYQTAAGGSLPYWVELVRSGNSFTGYMSPDGVNWTQVGTTQTIAMAQNVYVGLAVSSDTNSSLTTATFDNVSISTPTVPAPIITTVSATTGSIGSQVVITGEGFGVSQSTSAVMLNGAPVTINSWSNTSITITIPSGATSGPLLVSVAPAMNDSNYVLFTVTSQPLPNGWLDQDIGPVGIAGSATYSSGTYTINGSGQGVFYAADQIHYVYEPLLGDGSIVAQVATLTGNSSPPAGVMIRETLTPGATSAYVAYRASTGYFVVRSTTGATSTYQTGGSPTLPYWVKLVRSAGTFSGYISPDGVTWTQVGTTQAITMAQNVYIGFAVSSDTNSSLATATYGSVTVTPGATPNVSSLSPYSGGVGTPVTIYGTDFGSTQGTSTVTFNGSSAASITNWTSSQITATVPSNVVSGPGPVVVTVNSLPSNATVLFTAFNPIISGLSPPAGPAGGTVIISGSGFGAVQTNSQVQFNGIAAHNAGWSDTSVTVAVPTNATSGPVTVTVNGYTSPGVSFSVIENLSVTAISPSVGAIGSSVTFTGTGFGASQSDSVATFDGIPATISSWSDTQIVAIVPTGAATGSVSVSVAGTTTYGPTFEINSSITLTDSLGNQSTYGTVMVGGKWYVSTSQGSGCSTCTVRGSIQNTYDNYGNVLTTTDELGHVTSYTYDANQNMLTKSVQANSGYATTTYTYNAFGEPLTVTDPLGNTTTNAYDGNGNLLSVTTPAPNGNTGASVTQFAYNSLGEMTQITDPLGRLTKLTYTSAGLISTITDPQQNVTTYQYDTFGNRTSVTDAMQNQTTFAYDTGNRLLTITYPGNANATFTYDYRGRRTSVTDQNGKKTSYAYDDADRLTSVTDPNNNVTQYGYDTESNLLSIEDANTHTTSFTYDAYGRVTETTFPSTHYEQYGYDAANNLTSKTDRNGQTINYIYDDLYRLTQKNYPNSTNVEYVYDLVGKLQSVTDPTGTYGFAYDNMGRLVGTTTQYTFVTGTYTNAYTYDANSNRSSMTDPQNGVTSYVYDTLNRLSTLTAPSAFGSGSFGFSYDALNRRTQMTRPNGISTNYGYDSLSHLLSVLHQSGGSTIDGATYTYDPAGNRKTKTNQLAAVTSSYTYDPLSELIQVTQATSTTESYSYDPVRNRLSSLGVSPYSNNTSNELTSTPNASYTYDNNGNTLTKTTSAGTTTYGWDYENRLISVALPGTGGTVTFRYDGLGRRVQKVFTQNSTTTTTNYLYDGSNAVEDIDQSGNVLARYAETQNMDEPLAELRSSTTYYYAQDGLGSVTSLTTSTGAMANTYTYDSYGQLTGSTGSVTNRFLYTAREFDAETGLYFYRARYYDPTMGRFLNEDPLKFRAGVNFYAYVKNQPVDFLDPYGLQCTQVTPWVRIPGMGAPGAVKPYATVQDGLFWTQESFDFIGGDGTSGCICTWIARNVRVRKFYREKVQQEAWFQCTAPCGLPGPLERRTRTVTNQWDQDAPGAPVWLPEEVETPGVTVQMGGSSHPGGDPNQFNTGCLCHQPSP